ncbi:MAG: M24 family metallopeptidase, partial [Vicinamibacterales bacterium]
MTTAARPMLEGRLLALRAQLADAGLHALLVTNVINVAYLSGLRASAAALVVTRDQAALVTDFRYREAARQRIDAGDAPAGLRLDIVEHTYDQTIVDAIRGLGVRVIGVEAAHITIKRFQWMQRALRETTALEPTERQVERLRVVKDEAEILTMREAARRLSGVARDVWSLVAPGRTEREVAADIDAALVGAGFDRPAFETIVASGPNSVLPHARPTPRRLEHGDPVLLDFGGVYDGYSVYLTRTGVLGPAPGALRRLHEAVAASQAAAIETARPGVAASAVDGAAREALAARGFGRDAFGHGTGHGL